VYNLTWASNLPLMRRLQSNEDGRGISVRGAHIRARSTAAYVAHNLTETRQQVLVYNGETDPSISSVKSQNWTFALGFPLKEAWRPWTFGRDENSSQIVAGQVGERHSFPRERAACAAQRRCCARRGRGRRRLTPCLAAVVAVSAPR